MKLYLIVARHHPAADFEVIYSAHDRECIKIVADLGVNNSGVIKDAPPGRSWVDVDIISVADAHEWEARLANYNAGHKSHPIGISADSIAVTISGDWESAHTGESLQAYETALKKWQEISRHLFFMMEIISNSLAHRSHRENVYGEISILRHIALRHSTRLQAVVLGREPTWEEELFEEEQS